MIHNCRINFEWGQARKLRKSIHKLKVLIKLTQLVAAMGLEPLQQHGYSHQHH
jgi:hypothetical protein